MTTQNPASALVEVSFTENPTYRKNVAQLPDHYQELVRMLLPVVEQFMGHNDAAHDYNHALRVLDNALEIRKTHGGDLTIIIAAALLHDIINYPKDSPKAEHSAREAAIQAEKELLRLVPTMSAVSLEGIKDAIEKHSAKNEYRPTVLESMIIQDADNLDKIGSIGIIRLYSYATYQRQMYHPADPFNLTGRPYNAGRFALDYVLTTLRHIPDMLHTTTARTLCRPRMLYIDKYVRNLYLELYGKPPVGDVRKRISVSAPPKRPRP